MLPYRFQLLCSLQIRLVKDIKNNQSPLNQILRCPNPSIELIYFIDYLISNPIGLLKTHIYQLMSVPY